MQGTGLYQILYLALLMLVPDVRAQEWGHVTDEEWAMEAPLLYREANALILFDHGEMEVSTEGIRIKRHVRMKVLNNAGIDEIGDCSFVYEDGDKIKSLKAQTILPDGEKHEVGGRQFYTKESKSKRIKTFSFPKVQEGCILEFKYINVNKRFGLLDPWYFQDDIYTLESTFKLILKGKFTYASVTKNVPYGDREPQVEEDDYNGTRSFTWTRRNIEPIKDEPYMGATHDYLSALHCQLVTYQDRWQKIDFVKDWPDLGALFTEYIDNYTDKSGNLEETAASLAASAGDDYSVARTMYRYVIDSFKTQPSPSGNYLTHEHLENMVAARYGTAEEKNILLTELLRLAGLQAWPVLISTRDHGQFNPEIYQLQQFNYVLGYVETDSGGQFLDASNPYGHFGLLPPLCVTNGGFLLDGKDSRIVRMATEDPNSYRMDVTSVDIQANGDARCSTSVMLSGYFSALYGSYWEREQPEEFVGHRFLDHLDSEYELLHTSFAKDTAKRRCEVTLQYTLSDWVGTLENNWLIKPFSFYLYTNPFEAESRAFPVDFNFPFTYHNVLTITSDTALDYKQLPQNTNIEMTGAGFKRVFQETEDGVRFESILRINQPIFDPGDYSYLRAFFDSVTTSYNQQLVLVAGD